MKKLDPIEHLVIAVFCLGSALYHSLVHTEILSDPYMVVLMFGLLCVGSWNLGFGIGKLVNGQV